MKNVNSLMENIPNKIRDTMGIVADVALLPTLESFPTYFRIVLPNLIYGFNDE